MLLNITWFLLGLFVVRKMLRWRSPLLLLTPNLLLTGLISPFAEGDMITINLIMLCWLTIVVTVAVFLQGRGVRLDNFQEVNANYARMSPKRILWLGFGITALLALFAVWLSQAGVSQFDSSKRADESGALFNLINAALKIFTLHAVIVLSMFRLRLSNPHVPMALVTFALTVLVGYLSSSRGVFVAPLLTIFFVRLARTRTVTARLKLLTAFSVPACLGLLLMALISADRRGDEGLGAGFQIIGEQVLNSDTGYGLSPGKDAIVWAYSEQSQVPLVGAVLLGGFYGLVPRAIWPGKPTFVSTGPIAGAFVFRGQEYVTSGAGIPISLPSEIALAFGSAWFLPGMVVTALIMVLVAESLRRYPLMMFPVMVFFAGLMAHGLPKSQLMLTLDVITLLVLCWVAKIRVRRIDPPPGQNVATSTMRLASSKRRNFA